MTEVDLQRLVVEYTAAVAEERAAWRVLHEDALGAHQRETAHSRWLTAAERARLLGAIIKQVELGTKPSDHSSP